MINVIGAGLAGCEAALALANNNIKVSLYEMKPKKYSPAHKYHGMGELVCSNSLKAMRIGSAAGLLKEEMRLLGSAVIKAATATAVGAGGALAVDREKFSDYLTNMVSQHKNITLITGEVETLPEGTTIIATGPLTSGKLADTISQLTGDYLSFYDAAAPIITTKSINMDKAFKGARYGRGDDDYINCPFTKEEYEHFHNELIKGETVQLKEFEQDAFKVYEGCMPIEVMAKRGKDTIRYGPLKPVGLSDPRYDSRPYAVVQLRKENNSETMYNLVGFQTNLKFGEQKKIFSLIPGLENMDIIRYGVMHRNTFINSPKLLNKDMSLISNPDIYFCGQITGVEGYIESSASGLITGLNLARKLNGKTEYDLPRTSMLGALINYITDRSVTNFQPMGCNMGILPSLPTRIRSKQERYEAVANRGITDFKDMISESEE